MQIVSLPNPLTVPTWLTAILTGVLAVGAIVTAVFAFLAFRKQAAELTTLKSQAEDQRATNAKLAAAAELQVQELRESLAERQRGREQQHRRQASQVILSQEVPSGMRMLGSTLAVPLYITVTVSNRSDEPIYDVHVLWHRDGAQDGDPQIFPIAMAHATQQATRDFPAGTSPEAVNAEVRFRDAAGFGWLRRPDGTLDETEPGVATESGG
jgi:hypothetical protein